jgi:hypothetical protein
MAIHVRHARLVLSYVCVTLIVTSLCLRGRQNPSPIQHSAAAQHTVDVQHAARFVLLNAVLGISAASLLFCSTGFALAGLLLFGQREKRDCEGLHFSDSPPAEATLARQRRETAAHTLTAANWAVALLWLAFAWSLDGLRWALPPLPPWVTTCAAVLCAINLATGAALVAKHSRWAPWLLPFHSSMPLNEPSRLVAMFEQLRVKCFGRRPGLPRAQKSDGSRRLRRCRSWDHGASSPCGVDASALSPLPIASPLQPSPLPATPCAELSSSSPAGGSVFSTPPPPPAFGTARSMSAGFTAGGCGDAFHTPPRAISRTYSEDEEVDLSAGSVGSISSVDSECGREFMDVLQANILSHPDDTLEFLQRLSPERTPAPVRRPSLSELFAKAVAGGATPPPQQGTEAFALVTPPLRQSPTGGPLAASGMCFAERKQAMTRVSATVDELLGAIVGELV